MMTAWERKHYAALPYNHPDFCPEIEDYQIMEWVEAHIEDLPASELAKAAKALGVTENELIADPTVLTESRYFERNIERFESLYRESEEFRFPKPKTIDWRNFFKNLEAAPF
jgi:hypothetical protein